MKFSLLTSNVYKTYGLIVFSFLIFYIYFGYKFYRKIDKKLILMSFNVFIFVYAIDINIFEEYSGKFWKPKSSLVSSLTVDYYNYNNSGFIGNYHIFGKPFSELKVTGASSSIWKDKDIRYDKVLLIVNESWGVPINDDIQKNILSPVIDNISVKKTIRKNIDFDGFTIAGELRELCQKSPLHFNLKNQETGFEDCIPHFYKEKGYKTIAIHGALGLMYDRKYWYPRVGFEEILFRDKGLNLKDSFCYSFPGNCDSDIAGVVLKKARENKKFFMYWLTLNTHSDYDIRDLKVDYMNCNEYNLDERSASCRNIKLQKQFFYNLSKIISDDAFKGTNVIIVGDHTPPIILKEKNIFIEKKVPVFSFVIE